MRHALRICMPDRPGALAAVTARLAAVGADIVSLDVIDREDGLAVDDLCVRSEAEPEVLHAAVEEVDGVVVEALVPATSFRTVEAPVLLAATLVEEGKGAVPALVDGLPAALWTTWALALTRSLGGLEVLAATGGAPALEMAGLPWLPLRGARRFDAAAWMPDEWRRRVAQGALELAAAPLGPSGSALLVGREPGVRFRAAELGQLSALARVAVASERQARPRSVPVLSHRHRAAG